jgi:hypothetical protein
MLRTCEKSSKIKYGAMVQSSRLIAMVQSSRLIYDKFMELFNLYQEALV